MEGEIKEFSSLAYTISSSVTPFKTGDSLRDAAGRVGFCKESTLVHYSLEKALL